MQGKERKGTERTEEGRGSKEGEDWKVLQGSERQGGRGWRHPAPAPVLDKRCK